MRNYFALAVAAFLALPALAAQPVDQQLGLQPAATPIMMEIRHFHDVWLLPIITVISVFVLCLLLWVMLRYNKKANPNPAHFHHNTLVEIVWTAVPVLILIAIAFPSFKLLYFQDVLPTEETTYRGEPVGAPTVTIKAIGYQWYWGYEYPDLGVDEYVSSMAPEDATTAELYRLAVDEPVVAPAGETVRLLVTAADVIHNWAMPAFGTKMDAIPGRTNETWFHVKEPGTFYGQCSELCGVKHAFMPIQVEIVPRPVFDLWSAAKAAGDGEAAARVVAEYKTNNAIQLASRTDGGA